jgi:hypothetical protein
MNLTVDIWICENVAAHGIAIPLVADSKGEK